MRLDPRWHTPCTSARGGAVLNASALAFAECRWPAEVPAAMAGALTGASAIVQAGYEGQVRPPLGYRPSTRIPTEPVRF